jgi:beta-lactamase class A
MKIPKKYITVIVFTLILIIIPVLIYFTSISQKDNFIETNISSIVETYSDETLANESKLEEITEKNFKGETDYSVVIKNLDTGEVYKTGEDKQYNSASLYKLWVMAVALSKINAEEIAEEDILSGDKNKFDLILGLITPTPTSENPEEVKVDEEEIEPEIISMTVGEVINKMITRSDNYAALLLSEKLGARNITNFLTDYDFKDSNFNAPPKTTADDIATYFEKLYRGQIIDNQTSNRMIEILKDQTFTDRIPKYLPENIEVAHKTGELFGAKHDAGIVFGRNGDYIIVVLSQTKNEAIAAEKIAKFSEEIFNYFESLN